MYILMIIIKINDKLTLVKKTKHLTLIFHNILDQICSNLTLFQNLR